MLGWVVLVKTLKILAIHRNHSVITPVEYKNLYQYGKLIFLTQLEYLFIFEICVIFTRIIKQTYNYIINNTRIS